MSFLIKLFLVIFVLTCPTTGWGIVDAPVREDADIDDLLDCLVNLDTSTSALWNAARFNGHGQTLANHLFVNHNGATGHTAIRRQTTHVVAFSDQTEITQAVSQFVHIVNIEVLRQANLNAVGVHNPVVTLNTLTRTVGNNDTIRARIRRFFAGNASMSNANGLRCFSISLPFQYNIPTNITLEDIGTIPDRPTIPGQRPCRTIRIWLPRTQGNRTPATIFLD